MPSVTCQKCSHANAADAETCVECGRHLHVFCRHCGRPNVRTNSRCDECRTQLHLPAPHRWKPARARRWILPVEIAVSAAAVLIAAKTIVWVAQIDFNFAKDTGPGVYVVDQKGRVIDQR